MSVTITVLAVISLFIFLFMLAFTVKVLRAVKLSDKLIALMLVFLNLNLLSK